jgi:predicted kinase
MSEIIVMCGLPGSGKSTYMKEHLEDTHVRINLDMLKTRRKEKILLTTCVASGIKCVIDNTNVTRAERENYIDIAKLNKIPIKCVYIQKDVKTCISQNKLRPVHVPDIAIYTKNKKFEMPDISEGFDEVIVIPEETEPLKGKQRILTLDFDGVLHHYTTGWSESKGGARYIPDPPVEGAFEFINDALNHFDVHVYSSRSGHKGGIDAMKEWFIKHGFENVNLLMFPTYKPPATVALDDRVLNFDGNWPSMDKLRKFKPWYKKK